MNQPPQNQAPTNWQDPVVREVAFKEYQFLLEDTGKLSDRRQSVNTLFVSINALFLTGVGFLLLQSLQAAAYVAESIIFIVGFLTIAMITTRINHRWLRISEQYRKLVNLRIRYLTELEARLRDSGMFPSVSVKLESEEIRKDGNAVNTSRGTFSVEEVLFNPEAPKQPPSFSRSEQQIAHTFIFAYWMAFVLAIIGYLILGIFPAIGITWPNMLRLIGI
ncbi:MAG TPA: hypothetical protein VE338_05615 [Ktedonobacterales bacterium]|jgi:hypothetical protein|nr:hypothetical protein [Ktedonobacterales bacterium]